MRGMGAQAVLLGIVLCVEDDSTSESREPKNEGKQNAFVLLPSGHGGSRTHLSTATPFSQQSGGIFPESCPLILFRITGRRIKPRADRRPLLTRSQRFRGRTSPDCQRKRLPVELPGTVALTGGCVFRGLLIQNRRVQTVQRGLFGAVSDSGLVVLLRAAACVSLVSSQGFSPPPRRSIGALTIFQTMLLCEAWSGLDTICGVKSRAAL